MTTGSRTLAPDADADATPHVVSRDATNGAPCLGIAIALGGVFWLGVSTLLVLAV